VRSAQQSTLGRLLEIRRYEEAARRHDFGRALAAEQAAKDAEEQGRGRLLRAQRRIREAAGGLLTIEKLRGLCEEAEYLERVFDGLVLAHRQRSARRQAAEVAYREARQRARSIERLEEKRQAEVARDQRRKEQKDVDEVALRRFMDATDRGREQQAPEEVRDE